MSEENHTTKKPKKLSTQTRNKIDRLVSAKEARVEQKQDLGVSLRLLFLCGLPLKSLKETFYKRSCGLFNLSILGHPELGGIPFGQDRLIPIWMATAFVHLGCPEDNTIRFVYLRDILRTFDLPTDGPHYQRLQEGLLRFAGAQFTVSEEFTNKRGKKGLHLTHMPLLRKCRLWLQGPQTPEEAKDYETPHQITLDPDWANEIRKHPVPIDLNTVKALRTHPGALDFYQWQAWREVKRRLRSWQRLIQISWPDCKNSFSKDGRCFLIRPCKAIPFSHQNRFILRGLPGTPR
jgi:hypothetical protein